ncbi:MULTISPECIES: hypothetical protein [unclassified Nocardiopsis]|uniref:hypothetical protein n=1 Tax=unclassified Nocardiopsis TaxID=2649073 RepID=UPI001357C4EE|nr:MULTISPECIES: hypothetical protein [unclassified Nocardiopsis]
MALPPFPAWALAEETLCSTAALLRRHHRAAAPCPRPPGPSWPPGSPPGTRSSSALWSGSAAGDGDRRQAWLADQWPVFLAALTGPAT